MNTTQTKTFREQIAEDEQILYKNTQSTLIAFGRTEVDKNAKEFQEGKAALVQTLKENSRIFQTAPSENELRQQIYYLISQGHLKIAKKYEHAVVEDYIQEVHGYGIIDELMKDDSVSDIQCIGGEKILYSKNGLTYEQKKHFASNEEMMDFFQTKLEKTPFGFDRSKGSVDGYLPSGSRIHIKGEVTGYTDYDPDTNQFSIINCNIVSIRKFLHDWTLKELIRTEMLDERMVDYLQCAFRLEYSCVVSGSMGSGKTSLINSMFELLNPVATAGVIEDAPEMRPHHPRCIRMWEKRPNAEGKGSISIEQNVVDTLRMNFKYVIIGETRTPNVAFEFVKSIDTGNSVCITSTHASDPYGAVMRILFLAIASSTHPSEEMIRNQLRRLRLLIHTRQMPDGKRRVTRISELVGFNNKNEPIIHDVFSFSMRDKKFYFHGVTEHFLKNAEELDVDLPDWMTEREES